MLNSIEIKGTGRSLERKKSSIRFPTVPPDFALEKQKENGFFWQKKRIFKGEHEGTKIELREQQMRQQQQQQKRGRVFRRVRSGWVRASWILSSTRGNTLPDKTKPNIFLVTRP